MSEIDEYSKEVFESAKRFLQKAKESKGDKAAEQAYLRAALLLGCCYAECQVNMLCDHFANRREFSTLEKSLLQEKDVRISNGRFHLSGQKFYKLEDRILFLIERFSDGFDKDASDWWSLYKDAVSLRNDVAHPRARVDLDLARVENGLKGILGLSDFLVRTIFGRALPYAVLGLGAKHAY